MEGSVLQAQPPHCGCSVTCSLKALLLSFPHQDGLNPPTMSPNKAFLISVSFVGYFIPATGKVAKAPQRLPRAQSVLLAA